MSEPRRMAPNPDDVGYHAKEHDEGEPAPPVDLAPTEAPRVPPGHVMDEHGTLWRVAWTSTAPWLRNGNSDVVYALSALDAHPACALCGVNVDDDSDEAVGGFLTDGTEVVWCCPSHRAIWLAQRRAPRRSCCLPSLRGEPSDAR